MSLAGATELTSAKTRAELFDPSRSLLDPTAVWRWFQNIETELTSSELTDEAKSLIEKYYLDAGLLKRWRRPFFKQHYASAVAAAASFLVAHNPNRSPRVLDLGCGYGTQSLLFAILGARVIALDGDRTALDVVRQRRATYERMTGRHLDITLVEANALTFDYRQLGLLDGVHSMFAFNMMQPSSVVWAGLCAALDPEARVAILDGNRSSWLGHLRGRRSAWSPDEFALVLAETRFASRLHRGAIALPPLCWTVLPEGAAVWLDSKLRRSWLWPVSHQILAQRVV
jgi:SAM-dependent methyltransferase